MSHVTHEPPYRLPHGADGFEDIGEMLACGRNSYQDEATEYLGRALAVLFIRMDESERAALNSLLFAKLNSKEVPDEEELRWCLDKTVENALNGTLPGEEDEQDPY